uniref:activating molecule in BECN1-regulated autophagy protein 1 isoform X4 n=1 Tax=Myxine glutinosa TaxID=7769 RepID=UPI00358E6334
MSVPICMDGWRRGKRTLVRHRGKKNAVYILCGRERGNGSLGTHRKLQDIAEDKACQMQWDSRKVDLPDSPRSTFLLAFSPDRSLMASTHVNHNIYITEVYTNHCTHSLVGHRRTPWCVTFHPSIKGLLASGCLDGEVRIWDLHGGSESWYTQNNVAIASLAFHPTVQLLVIATANEIHFWDWSRPEPFAFVKTANEMERVRLVRFDPLGHNLLTAVVNPSNQQPEEDTEASNDASLRQRSMLHAQLIRRAPMLHNYLHMPPFRPPGSGVDEGAQSTLEGQSRYSGRSGILYRPRSQSERLASTGLSRELRPRERARLRLLARASGLVENVAGEAADDLHQEDILPRDVGERTRPRIAPRSRLPSAALGRFTPRRFLLPDYFPYPGIFHERGQPGLPTHSSVRVFTGAVVGDGQSAVANNIADITYRLQWWNFTNYDLPEISNSKINVLVCKCKIYNDASCDISSDGRYLAAFVPGSHRDIADEGVLAIYSLAPHNLGEVLYQRRFGPNAISVSLSPVGRYILVGLASRRIILQPATEHMVAQVFRLQQPHAGDSSMRRVFDVVYPMPADQRRHVSINSARWLPDPGLGLAYGTNRGDLVICRPVGLEPGGGSDVSWDNLYTLSEAVDSLQAQAREMEHNNGSSPRVAPLRTEREIALMNAIGLQPRGSGTGWLLTSRATQTQRPVHSAGTQTDAEPSPGTIQEDDSDEHLSASSSESSSSGSSPESHLPQRATGDSPGSPHDDSTDTINNVIDSYHALYHQHETADQAMTASPASAHASPPGTLQSDLSDNHGELSDQTEPTAPVAVVAADSTVEENGAEASGSNSEEANDVAVSLATEDAAVVCHRLTSGGMSAVVTRGRVTTVASMGGFGNEIVVSHVVSSSAQTAPEGRGHVPGPAANTPPTDLSLGAEGSGLPCLDITLPQNVFSTDAHSRTHNENLIPIEVSSENIPDLADNRPGEEEFRSSSVISNLALQLQQDREAAESMTDSDDEFEGPSREEFISSLAEIRRNVPVSMETERELEENDNSPEDHLDLFCGDYSHW